MKLSADAQGLLDLRDIRDDTLFFGGGDAVGILEFAPVDYDSLDRNDQDEVLYHFLDAMNDIGHRLQVLARKTDAGKHPLYYLVVPAEKSLDKKKRAESLDKRCEDVMKGLSAQGGLFKVDIRSARMSTKKLMSMFKPYLKSTFTLREEKDYIKADKYHRVIVAEKYPKVVDPMWLQKLLNAKTRYSISMHIVPYSIEESMRMLEGEINEVGSEMCALKLQGKTIPPTLKEKDEKAEYLLSNIQKNREKMFNTSLYVDASSDKLAGLDKATKEIESHMSDCGITPLTPSENMYPALRSSLPILRDELKVNIDITSSGLAACFPFIKLR